MILNNEYSVPVDSGSVIYNIIMNYTTASPKPCGPHDLAIITLAVYVNENEESASNDEIRRWLSTAIKFKLSGDINTIYGFEAIRTLENHIASWRE